MLGAWACCAWSFSVHVLTRHNCSLACRPQAAARLTMAGFTASFPLLLLPPPGLAMADFTTSFPPLLLLLPSISTRTSFEWHTHFDLRIPEGRCCLGPGRPPSQDTRLLPPAPEAFFNACGLRSICPRQPCSPTRSRATASTLWLTSPRPLFPQSCKRESHCFEPFIDLALPIPAPSKGHTTLQDCLAVRAAAAASTLSWSVARSSVFLSRPWLMVTPLSCYLEQRVVYAQGDSNHSKGDSTHAQRCHAALPWTAQAQSTLSCTWHVHVMSVHAHDRTCVICTYTTHDSASTCVLCTCTCQHLVVYDPTYTLLHVPRPEHVLCPSNTYMHELQPTMHTRKPKPLSLALWLKVSCCQQHARACAHTAGILWPRGAGRQWELQVRVLQAAVPPLQGDAAVAPAARAAAVAQALLPKIQLWPVLALQVCELLLSGKATGVCALLQRFQLRPAPRLQVRASKKPDSSFLLPCL